MSEAEREIVCRQCRRVIPFAPGEGCPHCGRSMRDRLRWGFVILVGAILAVFSVAGGLPAFALLGLFLMGVGGLVLWDQRQRIQQAAEQEEEPAEPAEEESPTGTETPPEAE